MRGVVLIAKLADSICVPEGYDVIGIDRGALYCLRHNIQMRFAIGDFDSVRKDEYKQIEAVCEMITLPAHKNETDTEAAILYALSQGYDDFILYGGLGGRMDHALANMYLLMHRKYPLTIVDAQNRIRCITPGVYHVQKEIYTYVSFLALEDSELSLDGVAYPLDHQCLHVTDIYSISNEIIASSAVISLHKGRMLMMETKD